MVDLLTQMIEKLGGTVDRSSIQSSKTIKDGAWGDLLNSWGQGSEGNCSSVATIKAAMDKYGDDVFKKMDGSAEDGYNITMKDGYSTTLSPEELQKAQRMSDFEGSGEAKEYAEVLYAAMAKRAQDEEHEGSRTYERALHSLSNGEDPYHSAHLLGLDGQVRSVPICELAGADGAVAWSGTHAVYVDSGYTDHYGSSTYYNGTDTNEKWLDGGFVFE